MEQAPIVEATAILLVKADIFLPDTASQMTYVILMPSARYVSLSSIRKHLGASIHATRPHHCLQVLLDFTAKSSKV